MAKLPLARPIKIFFRKINSGDLYINILLENVFACWRQRVF